MTNSQLLERFIDEHHARSGTTARRRVEVRRVLLAFAARLDGRPLTEATPSDLMAWQGAEVSRGLKQSTVAKNERCVRPFFAWATRAGVMDIEVAARLALVPAVGAPGDAPKPYKPHELDEFREALAGRFPLSVGRERLWQRFWRQRTSYAFGRGGIGNHLRNMQITAAVSLALEEGLRLSEIYGLTLAELAPENPCVIVRSAKQRNGAARVREVPWSPHSRQCVREWLDMRALLAPPHAQPWLSLWVRSQDGPMSAHHFERLLEPVGHWPWHRFRHTFATERLRAGVPIEKLQVMMGHAHISTTLRYAQILAADVRHDAERTEAEFLRRLGLAGAA